jgi:hypothetical protein
VIALEWLKHHGWTLRTCLSVRSWRNLWRGLRTDAKSLLALSVVPLGLLSYVVFLYFSFADPLAFMTVQAAWQRETLGPVAIVSRDVARFMQGISEHQFYYQVLLDVPLLFIGLAMSLVVWRRFGAGYALFVILGLIVPASSATQSISRYTVVLFPLFILLGYWGHRTVLHRTLVTVFSLLSGLCFALFVNWYFVA